MDLVTGQRRGGKLREGERGGLKDTFEVSLELGTGAAGKGLDSDLSGNVVGWGELQEGKGGLKSAEGRATI